jgi:hypothetical protein
LTALGTWITLANYGPVWYPNGVGPDWRPYINGRWVPTAEGRHARIDLNRITIFANAVNTVTLHNVLPSAALMQQRPFLRQVIPTGVLSGQRFSVMAVSDPRQTAGFLARPDIMPVPQGLPALRAEILKAERRPPRVGPEALRRLRGMGLPPQSVRETPQMREQIRQQQLEERHRLGVVPATPKFIEVLTGQHRQIMEIPGTTRLPSEEERHLGVSSEQRPHVSSVQLRKECLWSLEKGWARFHMGSARDPDKNFG